MIWVLSVNIFYHMSLDQKDIELLEKLLYKNSDDIAVAIGRSFERLEERIDGAESRVYSRLAEIEEKVEDIKQCNVDMLESMREDIRELGKVGLE
jgi:DNA-binding Lrp family transcriptional regulator